jgi:ribosomal protein S18 acetylase RimI-like enzyme
MLQATFALNINYRYASLNDVDKLLELYNSLSIEDIYYRFFSIRRIDRSDVVNLLKSKDKVVIVAEMDGKIIGEITLCNDGEFGIVVHPNFRNLGIGEKLVRLAIQEARKLGIEKIKFYALASNSPMISLGKKLGFNIIYKDGEIIGILNLKQNIYN